MDTPVITAIIGSLSALLGASLGAIIQWRLAKENHAFQLRLDESKRLSELREREGNAHKQRLLEAHKAISKIARDFSITSLDIIWRSGMTDHDYDKQYLACCETLDEARAMCDLYLPEVSESLEKMYDQMNIFWGNFKEVLRLTALQEPYEKKEHAHSKTIAAAQNIGSSASAAKARLSNLIGGCGRGGYPSSAGIAAQ